MGSPRTSTAHVPEAKVAEEIAAIPSATLPPVFRPRVLEPPEDGEVQVAGAGVADERINHREVEFALLLSSTGTCPTVLRSRVRAAMMEVRRASRGRVSGRGA